MRFRMILASTAVVALGLSGSVSAHTGWSTNGTILASARTINCGTNAFCQAFALSGCNPTLGDSLKDGPDISIAKLPAGVAGHRAKITWTTTAGPLGEVIIQYLKITPANGSCGVIAPDSVVFLSGTTFQISAGAEWVAVMGIGIVQMSWKIEGVAH